MGRAERTEWAVEVATAIRLASTDVDERAARRLRRAERLLRREIGPSVPKARAAALLGVSVTALQRWIAAGRLPVLRRPGGREEVEAAALLELVAEVRRLREEGALSRGVVAAALRRLGERGLPNPTLRPNVRPDELRQAFRDSSAADRLREADALSGAATALARRGARRRGRAA
ncbi:MAG TPA: hypothetical protein VML35_02820 [Gaiellaceae bacterium]|nr:hypothetical protein [Gaiellaceae bacterium]